MKHKDKLLRLRHQYIKELDVLNREIESEKGKKVRFSPEIEQIWEGSSDSITHDAATNSVSGDAATNSVSGDAVTNCSCKWVLDCTLENNMWKCMRLFI